MDQASTTKSAGNMSYAPCRELASGKQKLVYLQWWLRATILSESSARSIAQNR